MADTNITETHKADFDALKSGEFDNFCLLSCFVNGEKSAAICVVNRDEDSDAFIVSPRFVALTPSMVLTDHEGIKAAGADG